MLSNLPNKEFKIMIRNILKKLRRRKDEHTKKLNKKKI